MRVASIVLYGTRLGGDSAFYTSAAERLMRDGPSALATLELASAPLYPVFMAGVATVSGLPITTATVFAQVILGSVTAVLVALAAWRLCASRAAAAAAGALTSAHPLFVFWGLYVLSETLFLFLLAATVERLLALATSRRPFVDGTIAGSVVLLCAVARPTAAPFAAAMLLFLMWAMRGDPDRRWRAAVGFAAPTLVVVAILAVVGRMVEIVDSFVARMWISVWFGLQWTEEGRATWGIDLIGGPADGDFRAGTLRWLAADPFHFVMQALRKLRTLWAPVLPGFSLVHTVGALAFYLPFYAASLYGLRVAGTRGRTMLLVGVTVFTVVPVVTFVDFDQRFRLPAELLLIPLASCGTLALVASLQRIRSSQR